MSKRPPALQPTEHEIQRGIMQWAVMNEARRPQLKLLFAIPNGGKRNIITAAKLKAEGVKPGVPDLFLPVARVQGVTGEAHLTLKHGLWLEVKRGKQGRVSEVQEEWSARLISHGHCVRVVRSVGEAIEVITKYLDGTL